MEKTRERKRKGVEGEERRQWGGMKALGRNEGKGREEGRVGKRGQGYMHCRRCIHVQEVRCRGSEVCS